MDIVDAIELLSASGQPYPAKSLDPEALRRAPDGGFYWAHERDERGVPHVGEMDAEALGRTTTLYGRDVGEWAVMLQLVTHMNEHLGQSIAYARMNGVVPPWSG